MPELLLALTLHLRDVLVLGAILFAVGLYLSLSKRNAIGVDGYRIDAERCERDTAGVLAICRSPRPLDGQVFAVFVITVAAAEAAVALALAVAVYKHRDTVNIDEIDVLRW
jgi:NADH:ubiquinone oxidoreductase subunit K